MTLHFHTEAGIPSARMTPSQRTIVPVSTRDLRVDALRGISLLMIFADHASANVLSRVTMHNFGFADAAEIFVLLAGFSATMAYGRIFQRDGLVPGLRRIAARCCKIWIAQMFLLVSTLLVVTSWTKHFNLVPLGAAPLLVEGIHALQSGAMLLALPPYIDVLPLYIVLLVLFPPIYYLMRRSVLLALLVSASIWLAASLVPAVNLPNMLSSGGDGWYFDPFSWQFLFACGAALAIDLQKRNGNLPRRRWATILAWGYLAFALLQAGNWHDWHLPDMRLFVMDAPDKSRLNLLRLFDIAALAYLIFSKPILSRLSAHPVLQPVVACGRHSLEVFSLSSLLALFARLAFRTLGCGWQMEICVNAIGLAMMLSLALYMERSTMTTPQRMVNRSRESLGDMPHR
jgi:hypothetical protein